MKAAQFHKMQLALFVDVEEANEAPIEKAESRAGTVHWLPTRWLLAPLPTRAKVLPSEMPDEEACTWQDSEIRALKKSMVRKGLEQLSDTHFSTPNKETLHWFLVEGEDDWPLSFAACCTELGYDAEIIRNEIRRLFPESAD